MGSRVGVWSRLFIFLLLAGMRCRGLRLRA